MFPHYDIKTAFLTELELPRATAEVIIKFLEREFTSKGLSSRHEWLCFSLDRAAAFLGKKSGVGKRFKDKNPEVIKVYLPLP